MAIPTTTIFLIGGGILLFVLLALGGGLIWFLKKSKGKHPFLLYSLDGFRVQTLNAQVKKDPKNPSNKRFFFPGISDSLSIRAPSKWIGNKAYREVYFNDNGELSYVKDTIINKEGYYKINILPEEKALALHRYKENAARYENPMNKTQAAMVIVGMLLVLLLAMGIVYASITYVNASKNFAVVSEKNAEVQKSTKETAIIMKDLAETNIQIAAALTGNVNLTRKLS